jgi:hypothetical protein
LVSTSAGWALHSQVERDGPCLTKDKF